MMMTPAVRESADRRKAAFLCHIRFADRRVIRCGGFDLLQRGDEDPFEKKCFMRRPGGIETGRGLKRSRVWRVGSLFVRLRILHFPAHPGNLVAQFVALFPTVWWRVPWPGVQQSMDLGGQGSSSASSARIG